MLNRLLRSGSLAPGPNRPRPVNLHRIAADEKIARYTATSKYNADAGFLAELHQLGAATAKQWLADHFDQIGVRSSCEVSRLQVNIGP